MKKIFFFVAALAATMMAQATVFVDETFTDFPGTAWNASGSVTTGTGRTQDAALTYSDGDKTWVLSGKGNSVKTGLDASSSYQHTKSLPANITSDYYVAFMLRADGQQKQGQLQVFGLGSPSLGARVWLGKGQVDATKCRLGVTRSSGTSGDIQWAASEFATDQTMLVVLKYTMTATDTIASIYVNPAIGGTEPATPLALDNSKGVNKCKKSVTNMTFYTNGSTKSYFTVGGVRVCTDWAEAVAEATPAAVDLTFGIEGLNDYSYDADEESAIWYLSWKGQDQSSTEYKVALFRTGNMANKFGHFTTEDFDLVDSYINSNAIDGGECGITAVDVTLTETEYGFTIAGSVTGTNGVTYNLTGEYAVPKATPSVTEFSSLDDLDGMTITFTGVTLELDPFVEEDGFILLMDTTGMSEESEPITYAVAESFSFNDNVLTISSFASEETLPLEEKDLTIFIGDVFKTYHDMFVTIHYIPTPTALENTNAEVKATKLIENGHVVILRDGKKFNLVGAEL